MPKINIKRESEVGRSIRVQQLEAMFDVPAAEISQLEWRGEIPIEEENWNVGLIVGPSGSGKSTILTECFGKEKQFRWNKPAVIDDFANRSMEEITSVCQAVGFNTIPAWMRPYKVLSNGEKFRVELARRLMEAPEPIVIDEFTSVVDRQVAKIGSHAVQKYVRRNDKRLIAASCHYDIINWLQPDWVLDVATMQFKRRRFRPRPKLDLKISYVPYAAWSLFSKYHYMSASLNKSARCYCAFVDGQPTTIAANLKRPHPKAKNIYGCSRVVTLPDWQGLGLAMILLDTLGAAYKALGQRYRMYPAHPSFIRTFSKSPVWSLQKRGGEFSPRRGPTSKVGGFGGRPNATFEYIGEAMDKPDAQRLIERNPMPV